MRRRYGRIGVAAGRPPRRYLRGLSGVEGILVSSVDEVSVAKLRKAMSRRTVKPLLGGLGDLSLILRTHRGRETVMVLHLVIGRRLHTVKHYGILGLRGWNPADPSLIKFSIRGRAMEFDLLRGVWRRKR